jgi:hypothetical protein
MQIKVVRSTILNLIKIGAVHHCKETDGRVKLFDMDMSGVDGMSVAN